jgi:hypothetical protein
LIDVLPGTILVSIGIAIAYPTLLTAATTAARPDVTGVVSGLVNTASVLGGAIGMAALNSVAAVHTQSLVASGVQKLTALNSGYHAAFLWCAIAMLAAAIVCTIIPKTGGASSSEENLKEGSAALPSQSS